MERQDRKRNVNRRSSNNRPQGRSTAKQTKPSQDLMADLSVESLMGNVKRNISRDKKRTAINTNSNKRFEKRPAAKNVQKQQPQDNRKQENRNIKQNNRPAKQEKKGNQKRNQGRNKRNDRTKVVRRPENIKKTTVTTITTKGGKSLKTIFLGGQEEVGRNMTVFEYGNDIVIIDMGMQFPEEDMPGIDYIIPNIEYLKGKEKNIRGVVFTHGHLDHIGATPLLLEKLGYPTVIGSKFTVYMIKDRVEDYKKGAGKYVKTKVLTGLNEKIRLGNFRVGFFEVAHSIMDAVGITLETPAGTVIHPGDWKMERDKNDRAIGFEGLDNLQRPTTLMLESLAMNYKHKPVPEEEMYKNIEILVKNAPGRIVIGTFSSNVERVKVVLDMAKKYDKKVAIDGYSMKKNIQIAKELGYVKLDLKNVIDIKAADKVPDNKLIVICTGAQGEDRAVLNRIANGQHRYIQFKKQDTVVFSSSVIPGNERTVQKLKDLIYRQSDHVKHSELMDVHSGGHGTTEDVAEILKRVKPDFFLPVYANHYMLKEASFLAKKLGWQDKNVIVADNGAVVESTKSGIKLLTQKVNASPVYVDGLGVSDSQSIVLRDRQILAEDGMVVVIATVTRRGGKLVHNPDIISRGFVYLKENKDLISKARKKVRSIVEDRKEGSAMESDFIKNKIRNDMGQFLFQKTGKRPMVLPVVIEV